jgi:ketol-acid reductoisomerase
MYRAVSETAKYGGMAIGPTIIDDNVEDNMRKALKAVQDGSFARQWINEAESGLKEYNRLLNECENLEIEKVGREVRQMSGLEK